MSRWVLGSMVSAIALAPLGFGAVTSATIEALARAVSAGLLFASLVFLVLGIRWSKRWAI